MKKIILICIIIGVILTALRLKNKIKKEMTTTVISRRDGPTSIFLAGKIGNEKLSNQIFTAQLNLASAATARI